jgi:hypothetical protein
MTGRQMLKGITTNSTVVAVLVAAGVLGAPDPGLRRDTRHSDPPLTIDLADNRRRHFLKSARRRRIMTDRRMP